MGVKRKCVKCKVLFDQESFPRSDTPGVFLKTCDDCRLKSWNSFLPRDIIEKKKKARDDKWERAGYGQSSE